MGQIGLGILLLSFPAVLSIRALGQIGAKRRWRMRPETISRLTNFPFTPSRAEERESIGRLHDTAVKVTPGSVAFFGCVCLVLDLASVGIFWTSFGGRFAWGRMTYVGMGVILLACGTVGLLAMARWLGPRRRIILTLTPTRLQLPSGSWIAWENIEDIGLFSFSPKARGLV